MVRITQIPATPFASKPLRFFVCDVASRSAAKKHKWRSFEWSTKILFDMILYSIWSIFWHSVSLSSGRLSGKSSFWYSILHIFWHTFCHSIWHIFQHFIWYIFWRSICHIFWHSMWHSFSHIFWHSMWHIFWQSICHIFWQFFWHIFWHSIWPLRSSGAHWARKVPGWGPAVPTGLGRSLVDVQHCPLRSEPCSWGQQWPTVRGSWWRAKSWQGGSGRGSGGRGGGGEGGGRGGGGQGGGGTAVIKSNNPHLAGGEWRKIVKNTGKMEENEGKLWKTP